MKCLGALASPVSYIAIDVSVRGTPRVNEQGAKGHVKDFVLNSTAVLCFRDSKEHCVGNVASTLTRWLCYPGRDGSAVRCSLWETAIHRSLPSSTCALSVTEITKSA